MKEHQIITVGEVAYYVRPRVEAIIDVKEVTTCVVVNIEGSELSVKSIAQNLARFEAQDDVYQNDFLDGGVLVVQVCQDPATSVTVPEEVSEFLKSRSSSLYCHTIHTTSSASAIPEGPYFVKDSMIHQVWRLYEDELCSFVSAVVPEDASDEFRFTPLPVSAYTGTHAVVAVPSRLYFPDRHDKPLHGKRITVKDSFHLSGAVTTMGSHSYATYYGFQNETAAYVKELLKLGAVIIGKTKMCAYDSPEGPPDKSIDGIVPFNPRGDGYQVSFGSSMGAGVSVAGYDWVDISLGSDTIGGIRMSAASYGLWGIRVTPGSYSLQNVVPNVPSFDSLGILARESSEILRLYSASRKTTELVKKPTRILYPVDFFPMKHHPQQSMQEAFLAALEDYLGVKHEKISLSHTWHKAGPEEGRRIPIRGFMKQESCQVYDDYIAGYEAKYRKKVYTSPFTTIQWQRGINTTKEERDRGLAACKIVSDWMAASILTPDTIMLIPVGKSGVDYRDMMPEPGRGGPADDAFSPMSLPTALGVPHLVVPIGQTPFVSRVSGNIEYEPVVGSLIGAKGTDAMLISVAQATLDHAGWPSRVLTGRNTFRGTNDNIRHSSASDPIADGGL